MTTHLSHEGQVRGFRIHALVFVPSIILMTVINIAIGEPYWFYWPLLGWGLGLVAHWFFVLGPGSAQQEQNSRLG